MNKRTVGFTSILALGFVLLAALHGRGATPFAKISAPETKRISEDADFNRFALPTDPESRVKLPPHTTIIADSGVPRRHVRRHHRHPASK